MAYIAPTIATTDDIAYILGYDFATLPDGQQDELVQLLMQTASLIVSIIGTDYSPSLVIYNFEGNNTNHVKLPYAGRASTIASAIFFDTRNPSGGNTVIDVTQLLLQSNTSQEVWWKNGTFWKGNIYQFNLTRASLSQAYAGYRYGQTPVPGGWLPDAGNTGEWPEAVIQIQLEMVLYFWDRTAFLSDSLTYQLQNANFSVSQLASTKSPLINGQMLTHREEKVMMENWRQRLKPFSIIPI